MRNIGLAFLAAAMAFSGNARADTADFGFLVEQRVVTVECQMPNDLMKIEDAIFAEGGRQGWSKAQTIRELEARRVHQVAKYKANPSGYCMMAKELRQASANRLHSLGGAR